MTDPQQELASLIREAIISLCVNDVLPVNATLLVLDPASRRWISYATGGSAEWFIGIVDEDAITEVYRGARLLSGLGETIVNYRW